MAHWLVELAICIAGSKTGKKKTRLITFRIPAREVTRSASYFQLVNLLEARSRPNEEEAKLHEALNTSLLSSAIYTNFKDIKS